MNEAEAAQAASEVVATMQWSNDPVEPLPLFYTVLGDAAALSTEQVSA
ncbi:MAG: hypothetical protein R3C44_01655 [Chloroflexota bacterium]